MVLPTVHKHYVEALLADEVAALEDMIAAGQIVRVERRGARLVAELERTIYGAGSFGAFSTAVPLLGQRRTSSIVVAFDCDNYDTDPPSVTFMTDWSASTTLPFNAWPKGPGMVQRHYATGQPFLCRPGVREFHNHFQHGDEPWDMFRGKLRPRDLLVNLAHDLRTKQVF